LRIPPFFRFGSWIGGDRDGNPFVTAAVTRSALASSRTAVLQRYRTEIDRLMRSLSVAAHSVTVAPEFHVRLTAALNRSGEREAEETLGTFRLLREMAEHHDRAALGTFILSMTARAADLLAVYLLAKYAGLFADAEGVESCTIRVVPLFETIDDLDRAPAILR